MTKLIKRSSEELDRGASSLPTGKIIEREVVSAIGESRRILETARAQAEKILAAAQEDHDKAVQQGLEAGREKGLAEWLGETERLRERARALLEQAKPQVARMAIRVAEKILRQRLETSPEAILPMVEEALRSLRSQAKITLHVHPADQPLVESSRQRWQERNPSIGSLEIVADESLSRGGCRIGTEFGMVDLTLETQIRVMERSLLGNSAKG